MCVHVIVCTHSHSITNTQTFEEQRRTISQEKRRAMALTVLKTTRQINPIPLSKFLSDQRTVISPPLLPHHTLHSSKHGQRERSELKKKRRKLLLWPPLMLLLHPPHLTLPPPSPPLKWLAREGRDRMKSHEGMRKRRRTRGGQK